MKIRRYRHVFLYLLIFYQKVVYTYDHFHFALKKKTKKQTNKENLCNIFWKSVPQFHATPKYVGNIVYSTSLPIFRYLGGFQINILKSYSAATTNMVHIVLYIV